MSIIIQTNSEAWEVCPKSRQGTLKPPVIHVAPLTFSWLQMTKSIYLLSDEAADSPRTSLLACP